MRAVSCSAIGASAGTLVPADEAARAAPCRLKCGIAPAPFRRARLRARLPTPNALSPPSWCRLRSATGPLLPRTPPSRERGSVRRPARTSEVPSEAPEIASSSRSAPARPAARARRGGRRDCRLRTSGVGFRPGSPDARPDETTNPTPRARPAEGRARRAGTLRNVRSPLDPPEQPVRPLGHRSVSLERLKRISSPHAPRSSHPLCNFARVRTFQ